jgi:hypothetical protein
MIDIERVRELLGKVPKPPEDALPGGVEDNDCNDFQLRSGIILPHDLRVWLKLANGPCVGPGGLYGIHPFRDHLDMEVFLSLFPSWRERGWIPIAGDGCGNHFVLPTNQAYGNGFPVLFVDTSFSPDSVSYIAASDLGHFLVFLLGRELGNRGWPFDKDFVMLSDPRIVQFRGVDFPWAARSR